MKLSSQVSVSPQWAVAQSQIMRILGSHAANINAKLSGADQGETGTATASFTASNKPGANNATSPDTWIRVNLNGTEYLVPAFLP